MTLREAATARGQCLLPVLPGSKYPYFNKGAFPGFRVQVRTPCELGSLLPHCLLPLSSLVIARFAKHVF